MSWTDILGNVASGGLLGIVGNLASFGMDFFRRKQEHGQRIELLKLEADVRHAAVAGGIAVARERGAAEAFAASQQAEGGLRGEHKWATTLRAATRPGLTWMTGAASVFLAFFPPTSEAGQLFALSVNAHFGMMAAWWFGQRSIDKSTTAWGAGTIRASVSSKTTPEPRA